MIFQPERHWTMRIVGAIGRRLKIRSVGRGCIPVNEPELAGVPDAQMKTPTGVGVLATSF
jgi:hypothetical protein